MTVILPDGRALSAVHEGPTGDWIVSLTQSPDRETRGRSLLATLSELLDLPHGKKPDWVREVIKDLAGRDTPAGTRYSCPCCDLLTLLKPPPGTFQICPVCWWEDDNIQFEDLDYVGGANGLSLRTARSNFRKYGVGDPQFADRARAPEPHEQP